MNIKPDGGIQVQQGNAAYATLSNLGNGKYSFRIYPTDWYYAPGTGSGIIMQKGKYCQGTCTVTSGTQTATVNIRGSIIDSGTIG